MEYEVTVSAVQARPHQSKKALANQLIAQGEHLAAAKVLENSTGDDDVLVNVQAAGAELSVSFVVEQLQAPRVGDVYVVNVDKRPSLERVNLTELSADSSPTAE